jgi:O-antigen/teichoic acid export membrane protein
MKPGERPSTLTRAAAATYAANFGAALLSLLNVLAIARALGPAGRGHVAFLIAVAMLTSHLVSLSLQEANANIAASEPSRRAGLATNSVLFALALGAFAAAVVGALVGAVPALGGGVGRSLLWLALACVPMALLKQYLTLLVQADYGFAVTNASWLAGPLTTAICNGLLAATGSITVTTAFAAWALGQLLGLLLLCVFVARHAGFGRPDARLARRAAGFGAKAHVGRFMEVGNYRADQWLLGSIAGPRELGLYSIAVAWAELLFYLPGVLVLVQRPDLVRAGASEAVRRAARVCRVGFVLSGAAALALVVAAPVLCTGVFGAPFAGSVGQLRVLALGAFGIVAFELLVNALTAQGKPMLGSVAVGVAFAITVTLDLLLIPRYGGLGAAIATTAAYSAGGVAAALIFRRAMQGSLADLAPRRDDIAWLARKAALLASGIRPAHRGAR